MCYAYCEADNFPRLTCDDYNVNIKYNGNDYNSFFIYPNPHKLEYNDEDSISELKDYNICKNNIDENPTIPFSEV